MFFPNVRPKVVAEITENQKYPAGLPDIVQSSAAQAALLRAANGDGCEVISCYQMATWVLTFNEETYRLCAKHTMIKMRDPSLWENPADGKIEASAD